MKTKYCPSCKQSKPIAEFGKERCNKDGHKTKCRMCYNRRRREYYHDNIERNRKHFNRYHKHYGLTPRGRYHRLKNNCKTTGRTPPDVDVDTFVLWFESQPKECYYCSVELVVGNARSGLESLTIDRKDNNKGYAIDNIALACRRCNLAKGSWFTEEQMLKIAGEYLKK